MIPPNAPKAPVCERCGIISSWRRRRISTGWQTFGWCSTCNKGPKVTGGCSTPLSGFRADEWVKIEEVGPEHARHVCCVAGCGSVLTQLHHFAPRGLFGEGCNKWPVAYLCQPHHREWHAIVQGIAI